MRNITNVSNVTDYSGEPPVIVYSNPVTTVIRYPVPTPTVIPRVFFCQINNCSECGCCQNQCGCCQNQCGCCQSQCGCGCG